MTKDEKEMLKRIEEKLDKFSECLIRHDEKIKNQEKTNKLVIGACVSIFLMTAGAIITQIMR